MGRGGLYAIAAVLCIAAVAGIVALLVADGLLLEVNLIYTALGLLLFGFIGVAGASVTGAFAWVGRLAAIAAVIAFVVLMVSSWETSDYGDENETLGKVFGGFALFSFALAWAAIMLDRVRDRDSRVVAGLVVIGLLATLSVAALLTVAWVGDTGSATYFRITAVVAVIGTLATALVPITRALRRTV
jgi:hypothetical protein